MNESIKTKIIIGVILIAFNACNSKSAKQESNTLIKLKQPHFIHKPIIDTLLLLSNEKLPTLIAELKETNLIEKKKANEIPKFIKKTLERMTADNFSIANYGGKWQATDEVYEELPLRQLIYLGLGDNITLMAYYSGGIRKSEHILIFKHNNQQVTGVWNANILHDLKTKKSILKFLRKNINNESEFNTDYIYF